MAFNIGEIVVPVVNITTSNNEELLTAGISGTVLERTLRFTNISGTSFYDYQVNLTETFFTNSGTNAISTFWFTEEDLGGESPFADVASVDFINENNKFKEGYSSVVDCVNSIISIKNQMTPKSVYYDQVNIYQTIINQHATTMEKNLNVFNDPVTTANLGRSAGTQGDQLGSDGKILKELAENALGFHDITEKVLRDLNTINTQAEEQMRKAMEDDAANSTAYYNSYVLKDGNQNAMVPGGTDSTEFPEIPNTPTPSNAEQLITTQTLTDLLGEVKFPTGSN